MYAKPQSTFATYMNNILSYNIEVGNLTAWDQHSKDRHRSKEEYLISVLNRNYRTYWVQLSPSTQPYTKVYFSLLLCIMVVVHHSAIIMGDIIVV